MTVDIEKYRGIEIWFDTDYETFQCDIDEERSVKKSYSAVKKFIDEWKKDMSNFKAFKVMKNPNGRYGGKSGTVVGIRKDGRFILKTNAEDSKNEQISDYSLDDFILIEQENLPLIDELNKLDQEEESSRLSFNEKRKEIKAKLKITTLKDIKPNYVS